MLNQVQLIGRVGKDPEIRYAPSGAAVASFSLATTETWKDKQSGEKKERTEWHNIVIWGKLAEIVVAQYVHKGDLLFLQGSIRTEKWQDKQGQDRYTVKINCDQLKMLGSKRDANQAPAGTQRRQAPAQTQAPIDTGDEFDDDIPF